MPPTSALLPTLALALSFAGGAAAQTQPSPDQAHALETQITNWLKAAMAGTVTFPNRPVELTPEGDHYLVRVPLAPLARKGSVDPADAAFTGKARPLDGTRWALDDQQFPSDLTVHTTETVPDAPDVKKPGVNGTHPEDVTYRIKLGKQDAHGVFDTAFATPTTSSGTIASLDIEKEGGTAASLTHIGPTTSQSSAQPVDPAHANLLTDVTSTGYSTKSSLPDGTLVALQAERLHFVTAISGLAHDELIPLLRLASQLGVMLKAPAGDNPGGPTPEQKAKLHAMLEQAHAMLTGAKVDETVEGAKFAVAGQSGAFAKAGLSFAGDAPADLLSASFGFTLDGLVVDALPPPLAVYVPTHFAIRPTISNISVSALTKMGLDATAPAPAIQKAPPGRTAKVPSSDLESLFANGGINFGFDGLELDVAGTEVTGTGKFTSTGPQSIKGQAELAARGLDALIAKAQSDPMLQQAVPVIIILKGIARTSGDQSVWQITVDNSKVLVNGVDLSAMAGGLK